MEIEKLELEQLNSKFLPYGWTGASIQNYIVSNTMVQFLLNSRWQLYPTAKLVMGGFESSLNPILYGKQEATGYY